jgi:4-diphosphocytidyl-2-C-methyl-D-erythritol kinase
VSTPAFQLPSFAKINWSLRVLGRRPDGYHEVRTLLQTVSLRDELFFTSAESGELELSCNDPDIPLDESNLIIRAGRALRDRFGVSDGVSIHLEKRIPVKGGLGGASSNAAVALLGLARLWHLPIEIGCLREIGASLGADVPFFFMGGCACAGGTGTDLMGLADSEQKYLVIVSPNASVATASAYESLKAPALTTFRDASILSSSCARGDSELSHLWTPHNDFEEVVFGAEPEIARAREALREVGASSSLLSGSGSSVFGIFASQQAQELAVNEIHAESGWRVFPVVTLSRGEYQQEMRAGGVPWSDSDEI